MKHTKKTLCEKAQRGVALIAASAAVALLAGCAMLPSALFTPLDATPTVEPAPVAPSEPSEQTSDRIDAALQPTAGAPAAEAAAQMIAIHRALLEEERFAEACQLYRAGFATQLADLAGLPSSAAQSRAGCETMLREAFVVATTEAFDAAAQLDEMPLTPAFFVPSAIEVDTAQIAADEPWLAYVPSSAVTSRDTTEFRDGIGNTPSWLARSYYVQQGDDGMWRFAAPAERDDRS